MGVKVGVDFVEEVERGRVALLDGEDEGEGAETWELFLDFVFFFKKKKGEGRDGEMLGLKC